MRSCLVALATVAIMAALSASGAKAQTTITLKTSSSSVTFNSGPSDTATASFSSSGKAVSSSPTGNYTYSLTGGPVTLTLTSPPGCHPTCDYSASNTPLTLTLAGSKGTVGSLSGTVYLIDFEQTSKEGTIDTNALANVTITSASPTLGGFVSGGSGTFTLMLHLDTDTQVYELTSSETADLQNGSMSPTLTPEPRSMLLFGSGLFLVGGFIRRQLRA